MGVAENKCNASGLGDSRGQGLSTLETCEVLELTPEAVRVRLHRARGAAPSRGEGARCRGARPVRLS